MPESLGTAFWIIRRLVVSGPFSVTRLIPPRGESKLMIWRREMYLSRKVYKILSSCDKSLRHCKNFQLLSTLPFPTDSRGMAETAANSFFLIRAAEYRTRMHASSAIILSKTPVSLHFPLESPALFDNAMTPLWRKIKGSFLRGTG